MSDSATQAGLNLTIVGETNIQERSRPQDAFRHVIDVLGQADVLVGHMEGLLYPPSRDPQRPDAPYKLGWRHSDPAAIDAFRAAGFKAVSCASNVAFGTEPVLNTVARLDRAGIAHSGIGKNLTVARLPALFECRGVRFGLQSYTSVYWPVGLAAEEGVPGAATLKAGTSYQPGPRALEMPGAPPIVVTRTDPGALQTLRTDLRALRRRVDIAIASFHWGVSSQDFTVDYQRELAHAAVDAGADIVLGHHPHVVQAMECRKGKPIFYSLGNFAFDWWKMRGRHLDGIVLRCVVEGAKIRRIAMLPSRRDTDNDIAWVAPDGADGRRILDRIKTLSEQEFGAFPGTVFTLPE